MQTFRLFASPSVRAVLLVLIVNFVSIGFAFAEGVSTGTVSIPVDEITSVDSNNVKFTLGGTSKIVAKSHLIEEVLAVYLNNSAVAKKVADDIWRRAFLDVANTKSPRECALSLLLYLNSQGTSSEDHLTLIESAFNADDFSKSCVSELQLNPKYSGVDKNSQIALKFIAGINGEEHLEQENIQVFESLRAYSERRMALSLQSGNYESVVTFVNFMTRSFPKQADSYRKFRLAASILKDILRKGESYTISDLLPIFSIRNSDADLKMILGQVPIDLIHKLAERELKSGNPEDAMITLANISFDERTPTTHTLVLRTLRALDRSTKVIINDQVAQMLESLAKVDSAAKRELEFFWIGRIDTLILQYRVQEAMQSFQKFLEFSPDPSDINDRLRVRLAMAALAYEDRTLANKLLGEMSTSRSLSEFLDLWIAGLYGNVLFYVLALACPLVFRYAVEILFPAKKVVVKPAPQAEQVVQSNFNNAGNPEILKLFVQSTGQGKLDPNFEEYLECLKLFGLEDGVDLKGIKLSYRNAVKEIHPDLNVENQTPEKNAKFVELTQAYDRLRELHRSFGRS